MNSKEPTKDIITVLSNIIHEEADNNEYITANDKNYRYFGGMLENLTIVSELGALFTCVHDCTAEIIKELQEDLNDI